jgi:hypothetical protein
MVKSALLGAVALLCTALLPSAASAATNLDCMSQGYSVEAETEFNALAAGYTYSTGKDPELPPTLVNAIVARTGECADLHGWPPEAIEDALLYQVFDRLRVLLIAGTPLSPQQMIRADQAIASVDQTRLRAVIGKMIDDSFAGQDDPQVARADELFLGSLALRSGVSSEGTGAEFLGSYVASVIGAQIYADRFGTR